MNNFSASFSFVIRGFPCVSYILKTKLLALFINARITFYAFSKKKYKNLRKVIIFSLNANCIIIYKIEIQSHSLNKIIFLIYN